MSRHSKITGLLAWNQNEGTKKKVVEVKNVRDSFIIEIVCFQSADIFVWKWDVNLSGNFLVFNVQIFFRNSVYSLAMILTCFKHI